MPRGQHVGWGAPWLKLAVYGHRYRGKCGANLPGQCRRVYGSPFGGRWHDQSKYTRSQRPCMDLPIVRKVFAALSDNARGCRVKQFLGLFAIHNANRILKMSFVAWPFFLSVVCSNSPMSQAREAKRQERHDTIVALCFLTVPAAQGCQAFCQGQPLKAGDLCLGTANNAGTIQCGNDGERIVTLVLCSYLAAGGLRYERKCARKVSGNCIE